MADIDIRRNHSLGLEGARAAADRLAAELGKRFGLTGAWDGNVLRFERSGVNGTLGITASEVHLQVALGFLLKAMKGSIESAVHREIETQFPNR
jgi:putative polyhydroxyalkanoate system protein